MAESHSWQVFNDGFNPNANKQISTLTPGIYKISTLMPGNRCMHTEGHSFTEGSRIELSSFDPKRMTSYYWIVDYERDNNGRPVKDGTYTIRLYGTDLRFITPRKHQIQEGAGIYLGELDRDDISMCKWFVTPTRDGTGSYYIQIAADKWKYLHTGSGAGEGGAIDFQYLHPHLQPETYKWKFERVEVPAPLEPGLYHIALLAYAVHTDHNSTADGTPLSIDKFSPTGTFRWKVTKNSDNTYCINLENLDRYIHSQGNSVAPSARVDAKSYDPNFAHTYKWIITSIGGNNYHLQLAGNPEDGYLHMLNNYIGQYSSLEIFHYSDDAPVTYQWTFTRIREDAPPQSESE